MRIVVSSVQCPKCGAEELHPRDKDKCLVRAFKVGDERGHWWSQCLVCAGYYNPDTLEIAQPTVKNEHGHDVPVSFDPNKGWF